LVTGSCPKGFGQLPVKIQNLKLSQKVLVWFEKILLAPVTILGTSAKAGLNQKNSTSLTLGTQTAFDFYPPKVAGG